MQLRLRNAWLAQLATLTILAAPAAPDYALPHSHGQSATSGRTESPGPPRGPELLGTYAALAPAVGAHAHALANNTGVDALTMTVEVKNLRGERLVIPNCAIGIAFDVIDSNGNKVSPTEARIRQLDLDARPDWPCRKSYVVEPGDVLHVERDLRAEYDLARPGRYTVTARVKISKYAPQGGFVDLLSNTIELDIPDNSHTGSQSRTQQARATERARRR